MNASQQRRQRNATMRGLQYNMEDMDYTRKPKEIDALTKAQNIKAASVLIDKLYEQEVARSTPAMITGYVDSKVGKYIDTTAVGRSPIDLTPPADWPFSETEWQQATQNGPFALINKITGYVLHERERLQRQHEDLHQFGTSAVDPEQLERLHKTKDKQRKINSRNWRNRLKNPEPIELTAGQGLSPSYASATNAMANIFYDDLMATPVELNP